MAPQQLALRSILPVVPSDEEEKQLLIDDLTQMGCEGLLAQPWSLKNEEIIEVTRSRELDCTSVAFQWIRIPPDCT